MLVTCIDVDQPILNVYVAEWKRIPEPGTTIDLGLERDNSMHGTFTVLSVERVLMQVGSTERNGECRVNLIRKERLA